jgi:hypothetical protein
MMNLKTIGIGVGVIIVCTFIIAMIPEKNHKVPDMINPEASVKNSGNDSAQSFAVVELFTSEGCSSCPPADKVLGNIVEDSRKDGKPVFALAFHVDYWNRLGWKDEYSSAEYSERQRNYARALGSNVYTPQMVINGTDEFVGSNSATATKSIQNGLDKPAAASVALGNIRQKDSQLQLDYSLGGNYSGSVLNVAVVERGIITDVRNGENSGRELRHENLVRTFQSLELQKADGSVTMQVPDDVNIDNASVIAYLQNPDSKKITGASGKDLK